MRFRSLGTRAESRRRYRVGEPDRCLTGDFVDGPMRACAGMDAVVSVAQGVAEEARDVDGQGFSRAGGMPDDRGRRVGIVASGPDETRFTLRMSARAP